MILVMGATGNVGSKIVRQLLAQGERVRCLARHFPNKSAFLGAEFAQGDANNVSFLCDAMRGCKSVFTMIPPNFQQKEVRFYQNKLGEVIAEAIEEARVKKIVNLSSVGADLASGTGPILGLHDQEERLNTITSTDIVHLRSAYFMENLLRGIPDIITFRNYYDTVSADVPVDMIATEDIAARAAFLLMNPDFKGRSIEYLLGERSLSFNEAVQALGLSIKRPELEYVELSPDEMESRMVSMGLPLDWAASFVELSEALSDGLIAGTVQRTKLNTTATAIEDFARTTFAPAYRKAISQQIQKAERPASGPELHP